MPPHRERKEPYLFPRGNQEKRPPLKKKGFFWRLLFKLFFFICFLCGALFCYLFLTLKYQGMLALPERKPGVILLATDGSVIAERGSFSGDEVRLDELPDFVPQAVIAVEDRRFYSHFGIDLIGIARAIIVNVKAGHYVQGGSTITQQLAKNLFLTREKTFTRKAYETILAFWLESQFSKDEILQLYLNRVYYGPGAIGIEKAALTYFGKNARDLTLHQAAILAALLKAPSFYNPIKNPEKALERGREVLFDMVKVGFITSQEAREADLEPIEVKKKSDNISAVSYIVDWVLQQLPDLMGEQTESVIIQTTIDKNLQKHAETLVVQTLAREEKKRKVSQAAVVVLDAHGKIKALVGGKSYTKSQYNRVISAKRQPGSAFKMFVYLTALEQGATIDTVERDEPFTINGWSPQNYTEDYAGEVTLEAAYAYSINTISAKLAHLVGGREIIKTAHRLGIRSPLKNIPSLSLGTSEVTLLELTQAYVPFSNGGYEASPRLIERITTQDGNVLYQAPKVTLKRIVAEEIVGEMNAMMRAVIAYGTGKRAHFDAEDIGGKTGTTQDYRDAWFIGYSAFFVGGVWVGNDDNSPTAKVTGGGLPAEIWRDLMIKAHAQYAYQALPGEEVAPPQEEEGGNFFDFFFGRGERPTPQSKKWREDWLENHGDGR